jgi:hypothetical protein
MPVGETSYRHAAVSLPSLWMTIAGGNDCNPLGNGTATSICPLLSRLNVPAEAGFPASSPGREV